MKTERRLAILKIATAGIVGLLLLDRMILTPAAHHWKEQGERVDALAEKVKRGRQLLERRENLAKRWEEMQRTDLPDDVATAESDAFKAIGRWVRDSHITFTNLTPQWHKHDEGYETFECRAAATGDQASLTRFLYELEVDPMPVALHECELTTRDPQGAQLTMSVRFSFIRLAKNTGTTRPATR